MNKIIYRISYLILFAALLLVIRSTTSAGRRSDGGSPSARNTPVSIRHHVLDAYPLPGALAGAPERFYRRNCPTVATALHMLRLFGPEVACTDPKTGDRVLLLDAILDRGKGRAFFGGAPVLVDTREGVRCRVHRPYTQESRPEAQSHADQMLAVLAELGVPLDHDVVTDQGKRSVRQMLRDATREFSPSCEEIEWSVLAFALYLAPEKGWKDKFGAYHTFDEVAGELMAKSLEDRPCAGTHALYTLAVLARVCESYPILSPGVSQKVLNHLERHKELALRSQAADGSWTPNWNHGESAYDEDPKDASTHYLAAPRTLATGHNVEWMLLLPSGMQPPRDSLARAAAWLNGHIPLFSGEDPDPELDADVDYCPYSHAAKVLCILGGKEYLTPP